MRGTLPRYVTLDQARNSDVTRSPRHRGHLTPAGTGAPAGAVAGAVAGVSFITPSCTAMRLASDAPLMSAPSMYPTNLYEQCSPAKCRRFRPLCRIGPIVVTWPGAGTE